MELWSLDTEDDSKGHVELINFFDGSKHYTFEKQVDALNFLESRNPSVNIWSTNLGYDLVNLFRGFMGVLSITYVGSRVISAQIEKCPVYFKDTLNHWKISVAEMGKRIGLEKLEGDLFSRRKKPTKEELIRRCQRDSEITRRFVEVMTEKYESLGIEIKATIGATALNYYSKNYRKSPKDKIFTKKQLEFLKQGYYGGRTEIFYTKPVEGNILYHDFNSLYPSVMKKHIYPNIGRPYFTKKPELDINSKEFLGPSEGIAHVEVTSPKLDIPYLPYRAETGKLIFPIGTFSGHWTYFELRRAREIGYRINKVHNALEFSFGTDRPFEKFVSYLYQERLKSQNVKDSLMSDTTKLIMNNLYGKFAQGNEITKLIPISKKEIKNGDTILGDQILRKTQGEYPLHTNYIWAALTTAYGRDELWQKMIEIENHWGRVIYCDTDSVIWHCKGQGDPLGSSTDLGALKLEKRLKYAYFKAPKLYCLIERRNQKAHYRAKGVPRKVAKDFFLTGKAKFRRPTKLRESLRRKITANLWLLTEKEWRTEYDKRVKSRNGETSPIVI